MRDSALGSGIDAAHASNGASAGLAPFASAWATQKRPFGQLGSESSGLGRGRTAAGSGTFGSHDATTADEVGADVALGAVDAVALASGGVVVAAVAAAVVLVGVLAGPVDVVSAIGG